MSALLERLKSAEQARESAARQAYGDLVAQLTHGTEDPMLGDVEAILDAAGKSASDLSSDVAAMQHRNGLRDVIAESEAAQIEKRDLVEQIEAAGAKLEAAKAAYESTVWPLKVRVADIDGLAQRAADATRQLRAGCNDEQLLSGERTVRHSLEQLNARIRAQTELVRRVRENHARLAAVDKSSAETRAKAERLKVEQEKLTAMRSEQTGLVAELDDIATAKVNA